LPLARTWLSIRVELVSGRGEEFWPRPGRIFTAARSPARWDARASAALPAHEAGGGVQDAAAQPFRLGQGEVAVQADQLQPGDQVDGDRLGGSPRLVDRELGDGSRPRPVSLPQPIQSSTLRAR